MTGSEFRFAVKEAGYTQKQFADVMGVYRTTVAKQFQAEFVDPLWVYALVGLISEKSMNEINAILTSTKHINRK